MANLSSINSVLSDFNKKFEEKQAEVKQKMNKLKDLVELNKKSLKFREDEIKKLQNQILNKKILKQDTKEQQMELKTVQNKLNSKLDEIMNLNSQIVSLEKKQESMNRENEEQIENLKKYLIETLDKVKDTTDNIGDQLEDIANEAQLSNDTIENMEETLSEINTDDEDEMEKELELEMETEEKTPSEPKDFMDELNELDEESDSDLEFDEPAGKVADVEEELKEESSSDLEFDEPAGKVADLDEKSESDEEDSESESDEENSESDDGSPLEEESDSDLEFDEKSKSDTKELRPSEQELLSENEEIEDNTDDEGSDLEFDFGYVNKSTRDAVTPRGAMAERIAEQESRQRKYNTYDAELLARNGDFTPELKKEMFDAVEALRFEKFLNKIMKMPFGKNHPFFKTLQDAKNSIADSEEVNDEDLEDIIATVIEDGNLYNALNNHNLTLLDLILEIDDSDVEADIDNDDDDEDFVPDIDGDDDDAGFGNTDSQIALNKRRINLMIQLGSFSKVDEKKLKALSNNKVALDMFIKELIDRPPGARNPFFCSCKEIKQTLEKSILNAVEIKEVMKYANDGNLSTGLEKVNMLFDDLPLDWLKASDPDDKVAQEMKAKIERQRKANKLDAELLLKRGNFTPRLKEEMFDSIKALRFDKFVEKLERIPFGKKNPLFKSLDQALSKIRESEEVDEDDLDDILEIVEKENNLRKALKKYDLNLFDIILDFYSDSD